MANLLERRLGGNSEEESVPRKKDKYIEDTEPDESLTAEEEEDPAAETEDEEERPLEVAVREVQEFEARLKREEEEGLHSERRDSIAKKVLMGCLVALNVYMIILIYGVFVTDFHYGSTMEVEPVTLSVSELRAKNEFDKILTMYAQCRGLYEKILRLDYRMAQGVEEYASIATDYQGLLEEVDKIAGSISAQKIVTSYKNIRDMLYTWVNVTCGIYCDDMSKAVLEGNDEAAQDATMVRESLGSDFNMITENLVTIGSTIKGVDLSVITEWTPDDFIKESLEGVS